MHRRSCCSLYKRVSLSDTSCFPFSLEMAHGGVWSSDTTGLKLLTFSTAAVLSLLLTRPQHSVRGLLPMRTDSRVWCSRRLESEKDVLPGFQYLLHELLGCMFVKGPDARTPL
jgi:hypothetical protein